MYTSGPYHRSQLLDPVALTTTPTTNTLTNTNATFVQLANGDVLAYGGLSDNVLNGNAQVYRNATGLWTDVGSRNTFRQGSRGFLLASGDVLVVGGADASHATLASAEIYHPYERPRDGALCAIAAVWDATDATRWHRLTTCIEGDPDEGLVEAQPDWARECAPAFLPHHSRGSISGVGHGVCS